MADTQHTDGEGPMLSRTPTSDIFGKLDDSLPEVRINSDALALLRSKATANEMSLSEWVRLRLYVDAMGLEHVLSVNEDRIRRATGNAVHGAAAKLPPFLRSASK